MNTPNPKRPRHELSSLSSSSIQNPNYSHADLTLSSFIALPDLPSFSSCSFDRVLEQVFSSASESYGDDSVHDHLIERTRILASLLSESVERCSRKRALAHNYNSWCLPHDLTIKVFSMLDTKSLMKAASCCTIFRECSMDPLCYSNIDLTKSSKHINGGVLCSMISRSGKELRSLKIGCVTREAIPMLTQSCLASQLHNHGFHGDLLRSLHFYNLDNTCTKSLCAVLKVFPNLDTLKIFKFGKILDEVLKSLSSTHRLLKHLFIDGQTRCDASGISTSTSQAFVTSCPNLTSLTLIGFHIREEIVQNLAMGFPKLKYMNLSKTQGITGWFLSNVGKNNPLKTLILRDCSSLNEEEILRFLNSLVIGDYRFIRHIDISNELGFVWHGYKRVYLPKNLLKKLKQERLDVTIEGFS